MILDGGTRACTRLATVLWVGVSIRSLSSKDTRFVPRFGLQIFTNIYEPQGVLSEIIQDLPAGLGMGLRLFPTVVASLPWTSTWTCRPPSHLVVDGPSKAHRNM